jgi:cell division protein FtsB
MSNRTRKTQAIKEQRPTSSIARQRMKLETNLNGIRILNSTLMERLKQQQDENQKLTTINAQLKQEITTLHQQIKIKKFGDLLP